MKPNFAIAINAFTPVNGGSVDIQSIVVEGEGVTAGAIQIQTLTSGGETAETFYWIPADEVGDYDMEAAGWFDVDNWCVADKTFADGEGFLTSNDFGDGATIMFAGQVADGATESEISSNFAVAGNCTPVAVDIQSIVVTGEGVTAGAIQIQTLTSGGETAETFYWVPADEIGDYDMEEEGWFDVDNWCVADKTFAAGEGFLTSNDFGDGATLKIPSPL